MLSRRGFLKAAAATGAAGFAGASLTGIAASAAQAEPAASETLGFTYHNEHCLCNCMLQCTVRDGRLAMIQPRENEDKRFQNVCLKGISEVQNIYGDARIQRPMKRVGERGSGEFEAISWDEAFQMIAENFKAIQDKYGKEALWIQFSTEASQRFPPLLASVLGAQAGGLNGYDMGQGNGQIMAFSPWIGMFAQNTMWEWPEANVVILANTNLVETSLTWSRGMLDAQEAGTKFICLDPRFSPTAGKADQWVNLRAGTDPAFFLGMTKYILDEELFDREHVLAHTALPFLIDAETGACLADVVTGTDPETGEPVELKTFYMWDEATNAAVPHTAEGAVPVLEGEFTVNGKRYVTQFTRLRKDMEPYTLEWTAETCDIPAEMVADVAEQYAAGPSIIDNGVGGIDKFGNNDVAGHCYALIASLTGNYGKRGTGCGIYGYHVTPYEAALGAWPLPEGMAPAPSPPGLLRRGEGRRYPRRDVLRRYPHPEGRELEQDAGVARLAGFCVPGRYLPQLGDRLRRPGSARVQQVRMRRFRGRHQVCQCPHLGQFEGARSAVRKQVGLLHREGHRRGHGAGRPVPGRWRGVRPGASDHR